MAAVEYLAVVAVVALTFAGLLVLRPHRVGRGTPVDVIPPIVRLLGRPVENLAPRPPRPVRPPGAPRSPRRVRPRRPDDGPRTVLLPEWWR